MKLITGSLFRRVIGVIMPLWFALGGDWAIHAVGSARPAIAAFSPAGGEPGTSVIITGANFAGVREVRFNNVLAAFTIVSPDTLAATVPLEATTGPLSVTTASGTVTSRSHFVVAPRIVSLSPDSGSPGAIVLLEGANFEGATAVTFNGRNASSFSVVSATQIRSAVPIGASTGPVSVTTPFGAAASTSNFIVTGAGPVIADFSPANGAPGVVVTIEGQNFPGATAVRFNGVNASFSINAPTQIAATVPASATSGFITIASPAGTGTSPRTFIVTLNPVVTEFSPAIGTPGTTVVIDGSNFTGATAVRFNGVNAASFSAISPTQIRAVAPANATTGPVSITTPRGTGTSAQVFQVVTGPAITGFSPVAGSPGTLVAVEGFNFNNASAVRFGDVAARFTIVAASQINATVPAGAVTAPISVTTPAGVATSTDRFLVTSGAPVITSLFPAAGLPGVTVIIEGLQFAGATAVRFNGTNASFTVTSETQIHGIVPEAATTGPISVTTPLGTGSSSTAFIAAPRIASFSPTNGFVGSSVTIRGVNLAEVAAVRFGGAAADFVIPSSTEVRATVPNNTRTGTISVANAAGIVATTNVFTIVSSPAVLDIEETTGNRITISWPAAAADFVLQTTDQLAVPVRWVTVTNSPVVVGFEKTVSLPAQEKARFYRLVRH